MAKYFYSTLRYDENLPFTQEEKCPLKLFLGFKQKNFFLQFSPWLSQAGKNKKFLLNFRFSICLPLEFWSHGPLLIHGVGHTITQFGRIWIVFLGGQAFVGVHMSNSFVLIVVDPGLVAAHAVTSHKFDRPVWASCIQTVVVWHDLLSFGVGENLKNKIEIFYL